MKRKQYYELIEQYRDLIFQKNFNQEFLDEKQLRWVKHEISFQLEQSIDFLLLSKNLLMSKKVRNMQDLLDLSQHEKRCSDLLDEIILENSIEKEIYEKTYLKKTIWGFQFQ